MKDILAYSGFGSGSGSGLLCVVVCVWCAHAHAYPQDQDPRTEAATATAGFGKKLCFNSINVSSFVVHVYFSMCVCERACVASCGEASECWK